LAIERRAETSKAVMEMASDNQVTIVGNLTDDPELRYTPNGAAVAKFRVAVSPRFKDENGQWKDGDTSYFSVSAWRALAENAAESLTRGSRVMVAGRLQFRSWENQEGEKRSAVEVEADEVGPSLKWATARIERQTRSSSATSGSDWGERVAAPVGATEQEETPLDAG
jgi:single-strand DNA-binding protein